MQCVNLKERFGDRWRIEYEQPHTSRSADPWHQRIPCTHGHICPWGGDLLAACTIKRGGIAGRLRRLSFTEVAQAGDDGSNVVFPVDHVEEIAAIMKPKRKRPPRTESQRQATERLSEFRFPAGKRDANSALESPSGTRPDSEHTETAKRSF